MKWGKRQLAVRNLSVKSSREVQIWNHLHAATWHKSQTLLKCLRRNCPSPWSLSVSTWLRWRHWGPLHRKEKCFAQDNILVSNLFQHKTYHWQSNWIVRIFYYLLCSEILPSVCAVIFVIIHSVRNNSLSTDCVFWEYQTMFESFISAGRTWHISCSF